jgi:predicted secreted protein
MGWVSGTAVFFMIWWTLIFCVLPWGNRTPDVPEGGQVGSAPINPRIKEKFIATTVVSVIVWLIIYAIIAADIFSFHDLAAELVKMDEAVSH